MTFIEFLKTNPTCDLFSVKEVGSAFEIRVVNELENEFID